MSLMVSQICRSRREDSYEVLNVSVGRQGVEIGIRPRTCLWPSTNLRHGISPVYFVVPKYCGNCCGQAGPYQKRSGLPTLYLCCGLRWDSVSQAGTTLRFAVGPRVQALNIEMKSLFRLKIRNTFDIPDGLDL